VIIKGQSNTNVSLFFLLLDFLTKKRKIFVTWPVK
jgi:hypothetical protein